MEDVLELNATIMIQETKKRSKNRLIYYLITTYIFGVICCVLFLLLEQFRKKITFPSLVIVKGSLLAGLVSTTLATIVAFRQTNARKNDINRFNSFCVRKLKINSEQADKFIKVAKSYDYTVLLNESTDLRNVVLIKKISADKGLTTVVEEIIITFLLDFKKNEIKIIEFESKVKNDFIYWEGFLFSNSVQTELEKLINDSGLADLIIK